MMHTHTTATRSICTIDSADPLVQAHGRSLWTTSTHIAGKFQKRHSNVIRAIENLECSSEFSRLNFESRDYLDGRGKLQKSYDISRDGFSLLAMGFTGQSAAKWKEQFLAAFTGMERELQRLAIRKTDPALRIATSQKCATAILMTDCLIDARKALGKDTKPHHFANEHSLCNWVLTGCYGHIEEHDLEKPAIRRMAAIRRHNTMLIVKGVSYAKRKETLREEFPLTALSMLEVA